MNFTQIDLNLYIKQKHTNCLVYKISLLYLINIVGPKMSAFYVYIRPSVKSAYQKNNVLISQTKHMLWVLKKTVSMRRFF